LRELRERKAQKKQTLMKTDQETTQEDQTKKSFTIIDQRISKKIGKSNQIISFTNNRTQRANKMKEKRLKV
jgi:hypothetical protein